MRWRTPGRRVVSLAGLRVVDPGVVEVAVAHGCRVADHRHDARVEVERSPDHLAVRLASQERPLERLELLAGGVRGERRVGRVHRVGGLEVAVVPERDVRVEHLLVLG